MKPLADGNIVTTLLFTSIIIFWSGQTFSNEISSTECKVDYKNLIDRLLGYLQRSTDHQLGEKYCISREKKALYIKLDDSYKQTKLLDIVFRQSLNASSAEKERSLDFETISLPAKAATTTSSEIGPTLSPTKTLPDHSTRKSNKKPTN